jgi:hypothetical protein
MAGVFIVPVEQEYHKITPELLSEMIEEITIPKQEQDRIINRLMHTQPTISVGIMSAQEIEFSLAGGQRQKAGFKDGKIEYDGALHDELYFKQAAPEISDAAYDQLKRELAALERTHPEWAAAKPGNYTATLRVQVLLVG